MLPIALTCPLWWVARWTARMLASLAVVVACSLGAATLPVGVAAQAAAAQAAPGPVDTWTVRAGSPDRALGFVPTGSPDTVTGAAARAGAATADVDPGTAADRPVVPAPAAPRPAGVAPPERYPLPVGLVPATVGSRAPPAR
ncbi:hypothetical protein Q2K19_00930 [Micromonospora soli]|uniref:hypothetical protein n=1 Tax=Micromonospora sp. NBRC 110009 TaxID=3061627 RepID=UPI0026719646|nr:hypothetical protein [Micromonospora sp. NBRC 110009]WKT99113.1 hypothetical protein Q2K19_00930 [Micromonospora sp. NBRC 110009]